MLMKKFIKKPVTQIKNLIQKTKKHTLTIKLKENAAYTKKISKILKQLDPLEKASPCHYIYIKTFKSFSISELFKKKLYSCFANELFQRLSAAARKFDIVSLQRTIRMIGLN